jgi:hypothetical protein
MLQLVVTGAAASGSIALSGTNQFGVTTTETVLASGNGTYYSANVYSAIATSGVTVTGLTSGSLAVNGFFATKFTFLMPSDPVMTFSAAVFTGTDSACYPFGTITSGDFIHDVMKQITLDSKVITQDRIALGDRTTTSLSTSRLATFGQPSDYPAAGWNTTCYIDAVTGTAGTTQYVDLESCKISVDTGAKETYVAKNQQVFDRMYYEPAEVKFEAIVDFTTQAEYEQFRQWQKRLFVLKFQDKNYLGTSSSVAQYKYWQWTLPVRYTVFDLDRSKEKVNAKVNGVAEYSESLGYGAKLDIVAQQSPSYSTS